MSQLQPVVWSKGTFLTPQHLQVQDRFVESCLQFRLEALRFRPWGFLELKVNQQALASGSFDVTSATGIFPDGLPFDFPLGDAGPGERPFGEMFGPDQESLDVYLAIPGYSERGLNVTGSNGGASRFSRETVSVRDDIAGGSERPIEIARKNLRILLEGESREGFSVLRTARVRRTAAGTFELDHQFVPPLLDFTANDCVAGILRRLVEILSAKSSSLAAHRRQRNQTLADFSSADIANFWLLYTVNTYYPLLRHLLETRHGHPEDLFRALTALAGALTTFSTKIQARDLPTYDHDDLGTSFAALDIRLRELLETVVPSNFVSLPLALVSPSIYATAITDDKYLSNSRIYLAVNADLDEVQLVKKALRLIKVGSSNRIEDLIRQALPGVTFTHLGGRPGFIPIKQNFQYFTLSQYGEEWDAIRTGRSLAVYVPADLPKPQLELLIVMPQAS